MNKPTNINLAGNSPASRDVAFHMHPYTNPAQLAAAGPHIIAKGDGVFVHDDSGNRFYEGMSGLWCTSLGFSEPELVNARSRNSINYHSITASLEKRLIQL